MDFHDLIILSWFFQILCELVRSSPQKNVKLTRHNLKYYSYIVTWILWGFLKYSEASAVLNPFFWDEFFTKYTKLGGGFKYVLFSPLIGEDSDSHFDKYFSNGLKPPTRKL